MIHSILNKSSFKGRFVGCSPWSKSPPTYVIVLKRRISLEKKKIYIGEVLKRLRVLKSIKQEQLALTSNLDRSYVSELERNIKAPSLLTIFKLARGLEMEPEDLVKEIKDSIDFDSLFDEDLD